VGARVLEQVTLELRLEVVLALLVVLDLVLVDVLLVTSASPEQSHRFQPSTGVSTACPPVDP
jgi:hypothetical protein